MMEGSNRTETRVCQKHGDYAANVIEIMERTIAPRCPECSREEDARKAEMERRMNEDAKARRVELLRQKSGIPPRFQSRNFDNYAAENDGQARALRVAKAYADNFREMSDNGTCLIFSGAAGTGKTHLACSIASQIINNGWSAVFTTVTDALRSVKRAYDGQTGVSEGEAINSLVVPALLVLDEVGADYGTEHSKTLLFDIINKRYENVRPTIILTNLDAAALREYFGDRVVDRLREGGGKFVAFPWASHRS